MSVSCGITAGISLKPGILSRSSRPCVRGNASAAKADNRQGARSCQVHGVGFARSLFLEARRFMRCSACIPPDAGATRCPQSDRRAGAAVPCLHCADTVWKTFCPGRSGGFRSGLGVLRLEACVSTGRLCRPVAGFRGPERKPASHHSFRVLRFVCGPDAG